MTQELTVLVCGGRDFYDEEALWDALEDVQQSRGGIGKIIHGGARGADTIADEWAEDHDIPRVVYEADWGKHGRAAGPIRNQQMLDEGKPELVGAKPGGKEIGRASCRERG